MQSRFDGARRDAELVRGLCDAASAVVGADDDGAVIGCEGGERLLDRPRAPAPDGQPFGRLTLSISSFVPKPWTPFQWEPFARVGALEAKLQRIKAGVRRFPNVRVLHENPREASLQALLARGDRRVATFLAAAAERDGDWRPALREWDGAPEFYTSRARALDETLPWDHLEVGVKKAGLLREHERAGLADALAAGSRQ